MYLSQAISLAPSLEIELDPFQPICLVEESWLVAAEVTCSVGVPLVPVGSLQIWQVRRGKPGAKPKLSFEESLATASTCHRSWTLDVRIQRTKR